MEKKYIFRLKDIKIILGIFVVAATGVVAVSSYVSGGEVSPLIFLFPLFVGCAGWIGVVASPYAYLDIREDGIELRRGRLTWIQISWEEIVSSKVIQNPRTNNNALEILLASSVNVDSMKDGSLAFSKRYFFETDEKTPRCIIDESQIDEPLSEVVDNLNSFLKKH